MSGGFVNIGFRVGLLTLVSGHGQSFFVGPVQSLIAVVYGIQVDVSSAQGLIQSPTFDEIESPCFLCCCMLVKL